MQSLDSPLVTIHCVTFNHEKFLRETLDSFLMQKTTFSFEVIIHDDLSTDGTRDIIKEYKKKYPNIIKPFLEKQNQFSLGKDDFIKKMFLLSKGKYIAQCEGDDFWTDENKLQKQVDFLEKHADYALCFHPVKVFFQDGKKEPYIFPEGKAKKDFTLDKLLQANFIQSNSVLFRTVKYEDIKTGITPYDWYMLLYHAQFGKIGFINEVMSAYRRHDKGMWWEAQKDITRIWRGHGIGHLKLYQALLDLFGGNSSREVIITKHINKMMDNIMRLNDAQDLKVQALKEFPDMATRYTIEAHAEYLEKEREFEEVETELRSEVERMHKQVSELTSQLELIKSSRIWKMRNRIVRFVGKEKV